MSRSSRKPFRQQDTNWKDGFIPYEKSWRPWKHRVGRSRVFLPGYLHGSPDRPEGNIVFLNLKWMIGCMFITYGLLTGRPLELIAHRGGIPTQPENSMSAFDHALPYASGIETDIHFTRDNIPVILHDRTLDRTTECQGLLSEQLWRDVRHCRLQYHSGQRSKETLPSLKKLLHSRHVKQNGLILEIKEYNPKGIDQVMRMIHNQTRIRLSSFNLKTLRYLHRRYRFQHLILVAWHIPRSIPRWIDGLFLCSTRVSQASLQSLPKRLPVYLWTVNYLREFSRIRTFPIAGIITDRIRYFRGKCQ